MCARATSGAQAHIATAGGNRRFNPLVLSEIQNAGDTVDALLSERRTQSLSRPRQIAMFVARKVTGRSLPFIGLRMGGRDHTTILHGMRAVQSLIDSGDAGTIVAIVRIIELLTEETH
jgi:hypothetical protein